MSHGGEAQQRAYTIGLTLASTGGLTTEADLDFAVDQALTVTRRRQPDAVIDREALVRDLQNALNIFQPEAMALTDDSDHVPWLDARRGEINWRFFERYLRYLREVENRPPAVLDRLDRLTMRLLDHLEDPRRPGPWDRRGLVVGQVQSGKTGNYVGLITRAADAGYPFIVVLAGLHNSLRSQTQLRLDQGLLGFDTQKRQRSDAGGDFAQAAVGVGRLYGADRPAAASLTTSAEKGDFLKTRAESLPIAPGQLPILLVVKKHARILENLRSWIVGAAGTGDPPIVRDFPILLLDDEADNASVNTADVFVDGQYRPDDVDPAKVNAAIRRLLRAFDRRAYVGYTATANANVFMPPDVDHHEVGPDLFPRDFIEYIPAPNNYLGPVQLFGLDDDERAGRPLIREVTDYDRWLPNKHKNGHRPGTLPASVHEAIRAFVLARATRLARGQTARHNSMLIHVTRYQSVQDAVRAQIDEALSDLRGRIRFGTAGDLLLHELEELWRRDFVPTTEEYPPEAAARVSWDAVRDRLIEAVEPIEVRTVNGSSKEALEYFERDAEGFNVIAIGGDKLSRGLTLEGLTVSYYLRAAGAHDTLLQMGRWFGYREGYEDVCRLYTTPALVTAFRGVTEASEELVGDFREMAERGDRPADFGLKVRDSVAGMMVTARNKMRTATRKRLSFSGEGPETVALYADIENSEANLETTGVFLDALGEPARRRGPGLVWTRVPGEDIADRFFAPFRSPGAAWRVQGDAIASYIRDRVAHGEVLEWTVMLVSSADARRTDKVGGHTVNLVERSCTSEASLADHGLYSIKLLRSPTHELIDLSEQQRDAALAETIEAWKENPKRRETEPDRPSGWAARRQRDPRHGLLIVYPLTPPRPETLEPKVPLTDRPVIGFLGSFPRSPTAPTIEYRVNMVYEQTFGAAGGDDEDDDQ